ncbi:uncharacterized protein LOC143460783 [Clavelina lepadiformis]|uniref:uncharacterized protein LOC143460783 n=1 Tax=Clavelina lepadiformis TaxID=159417 RepID=UPI00404345AE
MEESDLSHLENSTLSSASSLQTSVVIDIEGLNYPPERYSYEEGRYQPSYPPYIDIGSGYPQSRNITTVAAVQPCGTSGQNLAQETAMAHNDFVSIEPPPGRAEVVEMGTSDLTTLRNGVNETVESINNVSQVGESNILPKMIFSKPSTSRNAATEELTNTEDYGTQNSLPWQEDLINKVVALGFKRSDVQQLYERALSKQKPYLSKDALVADLVASLHLQIEQFNEDLRTVRQQLESSQEEKKCCVCREVRINAYFLSCGHVSCITCAHQLEKCPICRKTMTSHKPLYF